MRKLAVIHFSPIELYPPVLNWLNYIASQPAGEIEVRVYTMTLTGSSGWFIPATPNIKIIRAGKSGNGRAWERYLNYGIFYLATLAKMISWRPDIVLYYETISSLPALLYKKYFRRSVRLLIHYHEYTSVKEYEQGMSLSRYLHRFEKQMYASAAWLSQTNEDRVRYFTKDQAGVGLPPLHVLPNYPPAGWKKASVGDRLVSRPLRVVYIGALSLDTMYTRELANWVLQQSGNVIWDIYTNNMSKETRSFLESVDKTLIRFRGSADYFSLPAVLANYDVGVILYKGHIPNYVYNAPNKLFEYMACGLDVWLPDELKGSQPYVTSGIYPKIISLNFSALSLFNWQAAADHTGLKWQPADYYCEKVLPALWQQVLAN